MSRLIAELSTNHHGDRGWIRQAVKSCANVGVDVIKVQAFQTKYLRDGDPQENWLRESELNLNDLQWFFDLCIEHGVEPMASVFDIERPCQLREIGFTSVKVGSGESMRRSVMAACFRHFDTVYASSGLGEPLAVSEDEWPRLVHLHCTSKYPCPLDAVRMPDKFTQWDGYSDHTVGLDACLLAIARGAAVVEKHLRLDHGRVMAWDASVLDFAELAWWRDVCATVTDDGETADTIASERARFLGRWGDGDGY